MKNKLEINGIITTMTNQPNTEDGNEIIKEHYKKLESKLGSIIDGYLGKTALDCVMDVSNGFSYDHRAYFIEFYDDLLAYIQSNYILKSDVERTDGYKTIYMVYWVNSDRTIGGSESFDNEVDANNYLAYFADNNIERRLIKQTYELER